MKPMPSQKINSAKGSKMSLHVCGEKPHCFQAAHSAPLPFVLEPQSQPACKIDELVHGVVTMGDSQRWGREGRSVCVR